MDKESISRTSLIELVRKLPRNILIIAVITLAIPLTIALSLQQQIFEKNASTGNGQEIAGATSKPNVVIFMMDDVNPMDGRFFSETRTPNIYNTFLSKGITFNNMFVETTLCCPGRAGNLSGQHTQNHGVVDLDGNRFNPATTIATEMKSAGYYPMLVGKYLNLYQTLTGTKLNPPGWSTFDAIFEGNGKFYNYRIRSKNGTITTYGGTPSDYSTDVITNIGLKRIKEAPTTKPLYLELNPYAIHNPHLPAPRHIGDERCKYIQPWSAPNVGEDNTSDKAKFIRDEGNKSNSYSIKTQCEMLLAVDDMVGKITAELKRQGRYNNTIFVLSADNGYAFNEHNLPAKTVPYATRVPLYVTWVDGRGITPRIDDTTISNIDLPVTFCELAGCIMGPYPNGQTKPDGVSFAKILKDEAYPYYRDAILESQPIVPSDAAPATRPAWWAIRTTNQNPDGLWHYIEYATGEKELYDLSNGPCYNWNTSKSGDPCELNNILSSTVTTKPAGYLAIKTKLATRLAQLKVEKGVTPIIVTPTPTASEPTPTTEIIDTPTPTTGVSGSTTINLTAKADSYTRSDAIATNYGNSTTLNSKASDPNSITFFKFTLPNLSGKTIESAILRLKTTNTASSSVGAANKLEVKSVSNSWTESNLKYNSKPIPSTTLGSKSGSISLNTTFDIDIAFGLIGKTSGDISFALESTGSNANNLNISSREASSGKPTLIITYK